MQQETIPVNPTILKWARKEAGLSLQDVVSRAKITPPRPKKDEPKQTAEARLAIWEEGSDAPTLNQLEQIAAVYRRPLITFFLSEPPKKVSAVADFRMVQGKQSVADSPEFAALRRRLALLHQELRALAEDSGSLKLSFIGSLSTDTPVDVFVQNIRTVLDIVDAEKQRCVRDEAGLLTYLRTAAQDAGIYVLFEGNVGSHHSNISVEEFRGMALTDELAPLIVINPNDTKTAMLFTFVHELAHLWLGSSGISNFNALENNGNYCDNEKLCNNVAAEFLVPENELRSKWKIPEGTLIQAVDAVAKNFKVSGAVTGRRLLDVGIIKNQEYGELLASYKVRWKKRKETQSQTGGAPEPATMDKFRLGKKTIHTLISAAQDGRIGLQDAARLMNIPVSRFEKVMR